MSDSVDRSVGAIQEEDPTTTSVATIPDAASQNLGLARFDAMRDQGIAQKKREEEVIRARLARRNRTDPRTFPLLRPLTRDIVEEYHSTIWHKVKNIGYSYFVELGLDPRARPEWCLDPSTESKALFQQVWGEGETWQSNVNELTQLGDLTAVDIVQGCLGAAVKQMVYDRELPWDSPRMVLEKLKKHAPYMTQEIFVRSPRKDDLEKSLTFPETVWLAGQTMVLDRDFQKPTIRDEAVRLATRLSLILDPQLSKLGIQKKGGDEDARACWRNRNNGLATMFEEALILKGYVLATPCDHEFKWIERGTELDTETMEEIFEIDGPGTVTWSVLPQLHVLQNPDEGWRVTAPAILQADSGTQKQK
ncbi:uncharacterized protein LTR77_004437 [Saxophila tyrrhenica]|uniref:Uncharacterized protein n=1 Tax=Saxophila tyrrhenica TaxID=1690608 RepID=A0AAV9PGP4_9PEZI|nr:hypothetical protein LTR77_004437 [Saxophila tyrrhenica]